MNRILGIDYGLRRIGLALSDPMNIFAKPILTIDQKQTSNIFNDIIKIIKENSVNQIVIGMPLNMKGKDSRQTIIVKEFKNKLEEKIKFPVHFQDERLSSKSAKQILIMENKSPSKNKKNIDSIAASIILQEFLDSK